MYNTGNNRPIRTATKPSAVWFTRDLHHRRPLCLHVLASVVLRFACDMWCVATYIRSWNDTQTSLKSESSRLKLFDVLCSVLYIFIRHIGSKHTIRNSSKKPVSYCFHNEFIPLNLFHLSNFTAFHIFIFLLL